MAEQPTSLDIQQTQVLIDYSDHDRDSLFHHRILLHRVEGSTWYVLTPDHDRYTIDLSELSYHLVPKASRFPQWAIDDGLYYFDPIDAATLNAFVRSSKEEAALLSGTSDVAGSARRGCPRGNAQLHRQAPLPGCHLRRRSRTHVRSGLRCGHEDHAQLL